MAIWLIIGIVFILMPALITIFNIINLIKKKKIREKLIDNLTFFLGIPLTLYLFSYWGVKDYTEPVVVGGLQFELHTPLSSEYMPTFLAIAAVAIIGYWIMRIKKANLPPIISLLCISSIFSGIALGILFIIQISKNILIAWVYLPIEGLYMLLFPINYMLCSIRLMRQVIASYTGYRKEDETEYEHEFLMGSNEKEINHKEETNYDYKSLSFCRNILSKSLGWYTLAFVMMLPLLGILLVILIIFGQSPDSIIKVFTETSDWTLSQKISPPPVQYEGHYLCTVALNGHKKLVKPTRMGIRHGVKIVVNRQLCIANAFEQLIEEKAPGLHRLIRHVYDKYGYPLSKHITTSYRADIVYILMKPLEWMFLIVLYSLDVKPENRIAMQYISGKVETGT
ncbi:MAG: hypothetical protein GX660_20695 [Clostridiaceae bacterium]|nr:hypothetical protein [Clostridiaceae bacterium]